MERVGEAVAVTEKAKRGRSPWRGECGEIASWALEDMREVYGKQPLLSLFSFAFVFAALAYVACRPPSSSSPPLTLGYLSTLPVSSPHCRVLKVTSL